MGELANVSVTAGGSAPLTMTSLEIAELTGKEHRNVMRDIRAMLAELHGEGGVLRFEHTHHNSQNGQAYPIFCLPKRETMVLVSGYSVELRARIVDRWMTLEAQAPLPVDLLKVLNDPSSLRGILLGYAEKVLALEESSRALEEKAGALDRIADAAGSFCITDAAKMLQIMPKELFAYLRSRGWIYRRPGAEHDVGYHEHLANGDLEMKLTTLVRTNGRHKVTEQVRITPKGLAKLAKVLNAQAQLL